MYQRALAIFEASYGPAHPEVATALNSLATLLYSTNRLAEAELLYRRALAIDEASYGLTTVTVLKNLIILLVAMGRSEAEARAAVEVLVRAHGGKL
jgi:hypothetical protein